MVVLDEDDYLAHYGILRRSGRYPWGSGGDNENIDYNGFLKYVADLKKQGLTEAQIAKGIGEDVSVTALRAAKSIAKAEVKAANIAMVNRLAEKGWSNGAIAERMGLPGESSVRALRAEGVKDRNDILFATAEVLRKEVADKTFVDVGVGVENYMSISKEKLAAAVAILREEGYELHPVKEPQIGTGLDTEFKVLCPPGTTQKEAWMNRGLIRVPTQVSSDGGRTYDGMKPFIPVNPNRVAVRYKEDGGDTADGVIYVREGAKDLTLGNARYAQVRIQVGPGHYLKGMAMYKDDLPDGVDLMFNTTKSDTGNKLDAMKPMKADADLPFGSVVRQILADPGTPKARNISAMNIVNEEGNWTKWSNTLSSQVLSKQSPSLAKTQLALTFERRQREFDEINRLTNPTIKKKLLEEFADGTDSAAVHLKAASLPRQNWRAILPVDSLPATQVYAPGYRNGERVALIRYPHGGTFEIPELIVNNNHRASRKLLGEAKDAIGIHHSVADRLSGADFDGDTVLVIPNNSGKIKTSPALERLKGFDPKSSYAPYDGMRTIDGGVYNAKTREVDYGGRKPNGRLKQQKMGDVSNLITDMTIKQASHDDIARAVKHSMVVIDSEKHALNYKQSYLDNGIAQLKEQYQGKSNAGAATLLSRKKSEESLPERKLRRMREGGPVDRETGRRVFVETGKTKPGPNGERTVVKRMYNKLDLTDDAHTLSSGTPMERLYADHSNRLKSMANQARLEAVKTPPLRYSPSAKKTYAREVSSLEAKLSIAIKNKPLERQAQVLANQAIRTKRQANPNLEGDALKKLKYQELENARIRMGAKKNQIEITQEEWNAIQAGAITNHRLTEILANTNIDRVRELATPRVQLLMTPVKTQRAAAMLASGFSRAEVADALGVSLTTLERSISGEGSEG